MTNRRRRGEEIARRDVLRAALGVAGAALASTFGAPSIARAASAGGSSRRFVFVDFPGGWDQLLFLDPRDPAADGGRFSDANRAATLTETRYADLAGSEFEPRVVRAGGLTFGPAVARRGARGPSITKHADRIAIVRGLNMGTLSHADGHLYFRTARFPVGGVARGSSIDAECAALAESTETIPVLVLRDVAFAQGLPARYAPMSIASIDDLLAVLDRGKEYAEPDAVEQALAAYARGGEGASVTVHGGALAAQVRDADAQARSMLAARLADRFRFVTGDDAASAAVRDRYGIVKGEPASAGANAAFAAQAIKQGVARCVSFGVPVYLDTHTSGNVSHARALSVGIDALAALIDDLATSDAPAELQAQGGRTWLDHTTVLAFSEFARTPLFNPYGGRDHHLASSCLLAGAGIAGGKVVGETGSVAMGACRYDYEADRVVPDGGEAIGPEHVRATILASAGLPTEGAGIHAPPIRALVASGRR